MTESRLELLVSQSAPRVTTLLTHTHCGPVVNDLLAHWIAYNIAGWLVAWPGRQHFRILRIYELDFASPTSTVARISVLVIHQGDEHTFMVNVFRLGEGTFRLKVSRGHPGDKVLWKRIGVVSRLGGGMYGFSTMPTSAPSDGGI